MKLGLQSDLLQDDLDKATRPSNLYNALVKRRLANEWDQEVLLARFVYALEKLGHRRYGFRAVRKIENFGIKRPAEYCPVGEQAKVKEFHFFQCLVEICVHLDVKHYRPLYKYSAKMHFNGTNPKLITAPAHLLTLLLYEGVITIDKQEHLVEALEIIGADKCIENIHRYRHMNNLPEIPGKSSKASSLFKGHSESSNVYM